MNHSKNDPLFYRTSHLELLDLILRDIPEEELEKIINNVPAPNKDNNVSIYFFFDKIPAPMEVTLTIEELLDNELTKINEYKAAIRLVCQVLLGKRAYSDILELSFTYTRELKDWFETQRVMEYFRPIIIRSRKDITPPLGYDQDFTTW